MSDKAGVKVRARTKEARIAKIYDEANGLKKEPAAHPKRRLARKPRRHHRVHGAATVIPHHDRRDQGQWNRRCADDGRSPIEQECDQNDDDKDATKPHRIA